MIPQIDNSINATDLLTQNKLPNKTYKLIFDEDNYISNYYNKLITFQLDSETGNLYVNYPEESSDTFDVTDGDLFVTSTDVDIDEKYSIMEFYLLLNNASKFLGAETVDRIGGFITDKEAIQQAIYHILMTERYDYLIYDNNYGVELAQYIGQGIDYLKASIEDTLKEALMQDERILDVNVLDITEVASDAALIKFEVQTTSDEITMEVNVNV